MTISSTTSGELVNPQPGSSRARISDRIARPHRPLRSGRRERSGFPSHRTCRRGHCSASASHADRLRRPFPRTARRRDAAESARRCAGCRTQRPPRRRAVPVCRANLRGPQRTTRPGPTGRRHISTGGDTSQLVAIVTARTTPSRAGPRKPGHSAGVTCGSSGTAADAGSRAAAVAGRGSTAGQSTGTDVRSDAGAGASGFVGADVGVPGLAVSSCSRYSGLGVHRPVKLQPSVAGEAADAQQHPGRTGGHNRRGQRYLANAVRKPRRGDSPDDERNTRSRDCEDRKQRSLPRVPNRNVEEAGRHQRRDGHQGNRANALGPRRAAEEQPPQEDQQPTNEPSEKPERGPCRTEQRNGEMEASEQRGEGNARRRAKRLPPGERQFLCGVTSTVLLIEMVAVSDAGGGGGSSRRTEGRFRRCPAAGWKRGGWRLNAMRKVSGQRDHRPRCLVLGDRQIGHQSGVRVDPGLLLLS